MKTRIYPVAFLIVFVAVSSVNASTVTHTSEAAFISALGGSANLIGFDTDAGGSSIATGTIINNQYATFGVNFEGDPSTYHHTPFDFFESSPNVLATTSGSGGGGSFDVVFTNPIPGVGLFFGDLQHQGNVFEILDAVGTSLLSVDIVDTIGTNPSTFGLFLGVTSSISISKLRISYVSSDAVWVDNLRFGTASQDTAVPEPSTLLLLGTSLLGLVGYRWRRAAA